jgi:hypothetical protein
MASWCSSFHGFVLGGSVRPAAALGKPGRAGAVHTYLLVNFIGQSDTRIRATRRLVCDIL